MLRNQLSYKIKLIAGLLLLTSVLILPSCNSGVGGSTGGNPLQSSLPIQISADVQ